MDSAFCWIAHVDEDLYSLSSVSKAPWRIIVPKAGQTNRPSFGNKICLLVCEFCRHFYDTCNRNLDPFFDDFFDWFLDYNFHPLLHRHFNALLYFDYLGKEIRATVSGR